MEIISEQVKKFIGNKEILKGINIDVKNKEFLGIIGPNGSGKSTFLKCIYRILKPSEGKILFNGKKWVAYELNNVILVENNQTLEEEEFDYLDDI